MGILLLAIVLTLEGLLYYLARTHNSLIFQDLSRQEHPLKDTFMLMGHFFLTSCSYKYNSVYDNKLFNRLAELYGYRQSRFYLQVHWAKKTGYFLLALLLDSFLLAAGGQLDLIIVFFAILVAGAVFLAPDYELHKQLKERHLRICLDFPDFISKLILLINAGMTMQRAWEKVISSNKRTTPLYEEAARVVLEIRGGKPEGQAYEEFARRCRTPEVTRFVTVVLQNLRKGNAEIVAILRVQANECWEMRKHAAKRLGEEAETKLILPMMLMFIAILLIVATPAMLALKNM